MSDDQERASTCPSLVASFHIGALHIRDRLDNIVAMRHLIAALLLLNLITSASAQNERRLEFRINGMAGQKIFLANYYGNRLYYTDSAVTDAQGLAVFARKTGYKPGLYAVMIGNKRCEVLMNEPIVRMSTDAADPDGHAVVTESRENQLYREHKAFANNHSAEEVASHAQVVVRDAPGTLASLMVRMALPTSKQPIMKSDGTLDSTATSNNLRAHFWDETDLKDDRLIGIPAFQNKLEEYIAVALPPRADTINRYVDELIARTSGSADMRKFMLNWITGKYETSQVEGMDAVYVHMARKYVCPASGQPMDPIWTPLDKWQKVCERARKKLPLQPGEKAMPLILADTALQWVEMQKMPEPCVVVVFWSPSCSHCKQSLPLLYTEWKDKLKPLGVGIYAVAEANDSAHFHDWKAFVRENHLDWTNVGIPQPVYRTWKKTPSAYVPKFTTVESLTYPTTWEVFNTPTYFVVDSERRIFGRPRTLKDLFDMAAACAKKGRP